MNNKKMKTEHRVVNVELETFIKLKEYCNRFGYKISKWLTIKINEFIAQDSKNAK